MSGEDLTHFQKGINFALHLLPFLRPFGDGLGKVTES